MKVERIVRPRTSRRALNFSASSEAWRQHEMTLLLAFVSRTLARREA